MQQAYGGDTSPSRTDSDTYTRFHRAVSIETARKMGVDRRVGIGVIGGAYPCHSVRWTTGNWSARSRSKSRLPTWRDTGAWTHL
jgi:hypothetical protein